MYVEKASERSSVIYTVWLRPQERDALIQYVIVIVLKLELTPLLHRSPLPLNLPWSQGFYLCCQDVSVPRPYRHSRQC